ncbi:alpha/beta hydrolase [Deinococcus yavapaiensis]|uniref:Acetyl esterase/lipase n=1 Tax=Deinococcus yavapaiensis KR-236 TaxID=694435 RepID=A0A318S0S8_9DEIO|nr:alpha/beta hydrolase [Deinococcus yavapaiensis]PYE50496.1 acetyl esterase/lipase [Deinococcus yavapaiensis KR-236]
MNTTRMLGFGLALGALGMWMYSRRAASYARLHPELRSPLLRLRHPAVTAAIVAGLGRVPRRVSDPIDVSFETRDVSGPAGAPDVKVLLYRPLGGQQNSAALLYIHGGGFITGSADAYHRQCARLANELGLLVVNVEYRLAPGTPFPGPLEDCYAALTWLHQHAPELGVDRERIAVAGDSAGAGLAASLAQLAHDRGEVRPAFQLLLYPMLDDRTVLRADHDGRGEFVWTPGSNRLGWTSYLGRAPRVEDAPPYAAPARREDLSGLAPAWIGVGTLDLFYLEDREYARRLTAAGVPCEFFEVDGAFHASELFMPGASVSGVFLERSLDALRRGLRLDPPNEPSE